MVRHKNSGWIEIICGPMFSGKTEELIRRLVRAQYAKQKVAIFKPKTDDRYSDDYIVSHNKRKIKSIIVESSDEIYKLKDSADVFGIDEAQFFSDLKEFVLDVLENKKINVVLAGLDGDFMRKPFGQVLELIPFSDTCIKKNALCKMCKDGTHALFSHRLSKNNGEQILVGSTEIYTPVCRKHYVKLNSI